MEVYGNVSTLNMEGVLSQNVQASDYMRQLRNVETFDELVDEVYNEVSHVEPWMGGNARGPSSAFCLVARFAEMRLNNGQISRLLAHEDSPYIRAVGFLLLRYVCDPKQWWSWFEPYLEDTEEFAPGADGSKTTIGAFVLDLLLAQYYFDTLLPRVPTLVGRDIKQALGDKGLPTAARGNGGVGGATGRGATGSSARPPTVKETLSVGMGQRAPNRTDGSSGRGGGSDRVHGGDRHGGADRYDAYDGRRDGGRDRYAPAPRDHYTPDRGRRDGERGGDHRERERSPKRESSKPKSDKPKTGFASWDEDW
eukprot:PRCOL_00000163-RA